VDGPEAARLVFPEYQFCFSGRMAVQNNGFAIRRGIPFACAPDLADLSMNEDVRRGVELRVFPGTAQELRLLSVHLKSGCARDPLTSARPNCGVLARQIPVLERWIDAQANERKPFAVLGDFNRDLRREPPGASVWAHIDDADPPNADLVNTAEGQSFQNCMPSQTFSGYIDYIILGRQMAQGLVADSFGRALFRPKDAIRRKLSDHCPVYIRLRVADAVRVVG
jgi:endonuclease/exonuclease/phosphatase family metal-dependent hydrolase